MIINRKHIIFLIVSVLMFIHVAECFCDDSVKAKLEEEFKWLRAETMVWSASKHEQTSFEAPSLVSVINANDIKRFGWKSLGDILQSASGFYKTYDRSYHYVGARGFGLPGDFNTRILMLIDGQRINDNAYEQAPIGTDFPLDIDLIDRVEITRGPGSCLYGTNAFFAVVNVISKKLSNSYTSVEIGSSDSYKGSYAFGKTFSNSANLFVSGTVYDSKGKDRLYFKEFDTPADNNGIAENLDGDKFRNVFLKFSLNEITLSGAYSFRDKDRPASSWGTSFNQPFNAIDERGLAQIRYERKVSEQTSLFAALFYNHYVFKGNYPSTVIREDESSYLNYNRERDIVDTMGAEIRFSQKIMKKHNLTIGAEYQYTEYESNNYDDEPYYLWFDDRVYFKNWAAYIQDEIRLSDNLIVNGGIRYDWYESFGGTSNPRISAIYTPFTSTAVKLIYGTAFRSPNYYEVATNIQNMGQSDTSPEKISTYEMIIEKSFEKRVQGFVSGFIYNIKGLIAEVPEGDNVTYRNTDDIEAKGLEAGLQSLWENGLKTSVSYTFQDVINTNTDEALPNSPKHLIKASISYPIMSEKLFGSVQTQYMSLRKSKSNETTQDFMTADATLFAANIIKGLEFSASVYNIFDKKYDDPCSSAYKQEFIEQNGRTFRFKFSYLF